jgi:hypothetical protein
LGCRDEVHATQRGTRVVKFLIGGLVVLVGVHLGGLVAAHEFAERRGERARIVATIRVLLSHDDQLIDLVAAVGPIPDGRALRRETRDQFLDVGEQ